jgi:hypothetical protein
MFGASIFTSLKSPPPIAVPVIRFQQQVTSPHTCSKYERYRASPARVLVSLVLQHWLTVSSPDRHARRRCVSRHDDSHKNFRPACLNPPKRAVHVSSKLQLDIACNPSILRYRSCHGISYLAFVTVHLPCETLPVKTGSAGCPPESGFL